MNQLDFVYENWTADTSSPLKTVSYIKLKDFREEEKECLHLRGIGWKWITIKYTYPILNVGEEYELSFWAKFDYYSRNGAKCYIEFLVSGTWENRSIYDINPNSPNAYAKSGDWVLYKFKIKAELAQPLLVQINCFDANVALMPAGMADEVDSRVTPVEQDDQTPFECYNELPFHEFDYLEQRVVKYYMDLLAPYSPCEVISKESQQEYYEFVKNLYHRLFTHPEEFFSKLNEDDAHPNRFNCAAYGKPKLKINIRADIKKIEELFELLKDIANNGKVLDNNIHTELNISKKQYKLLQYMDFDFMDGILTHKDYKNIGKALVYLAGKEKALWSMMCCWFDDSYPYLEKTYAKLYDNKQYERLVGWLHDNGYQSQIGSCSGLTLDYYKSISKKEKPVGYAIHGDKFHYGFTFEFRYDPRVMQHCEPRIIQFGEMLKRFNDLSEATKSLMLQRTKRCDGCRYCVQTDKTGTRPFANIKVSDGTSCCSYYPGFNYTFEKLTKNDVDSIISFITDMEKVVTA